MTFLRSKRGVLFLGTFLVLILFVVRPGANRLKSRVVQLITSAIGRPVEVAYVRVRLLPRPGFVLENFAVHEDSAFGAEPTVRAQEVVASLRITSLLRGRLEIARLDLTEPSLNIAWNPEAHWNIQTLLERAARATVAPTQASGPMRPRFPYVEGTRGRINFKIGSEKKAYALADADFAFWHDSENTWAMRLQARPMRTDLNLSDTGVIRASGTWQNASTLAETPIDFAFEWSGGQLGQASKLWYGYDQGWRGTMDISGTVKGEPKNAALTVIASAEDFRRYDVLGGGTMRLAAQCKGNYSVAGNTFSDVDCESPVGDGNVHVSGAFAHPVSAPTYDFVIAAQSVPAQSLAAFVRHTRKGIPESLTITGRVDAEFRGLRSSGGGPASWTGNGKTSNLHFASGSNELALGAIPLTLATDETGSGVRKVSAAQDRQNSVHLVVGPFHVPMGRPTPLSIQSTIGRRGYEIDLRGDVQIAKLLQAAQMLGIPAPPVTAEGTAMIETELGNEWAAQTEARTTGKAQLHSVRAQVHGFNSPLEIQSANILLSRDQVRVQNLQASAGEMDWRGSLEFLRPCARQAGCKATFELHANEIAFSRMNQLLNPQARKKPWYDVLSFGGSGAPFLFSVDASGKIIIDKLLIQKTEAHKVSATAELQNGILKFSDLNADLLGGHHTGEWEFDFGAKPPRYEGKGTLQRMALGQIAELMKDGWIRGTANGSYRLSMTGLSAKDLLESATGNLLLDASDGELPHISLGDGGRVHMQHLTAELTLRNGRIEIENGELNTPSEMFHVSGTASLAEVLNVKLTRPSASGFNIVGPLAAPRVSPFTAQETRAALKP